MTDDGYASYIDDLDRIARAASEAEEIFRKDAARRAEELRKERVFAFRRLNLLRAVGNAVRSVDEAEEAQANGRHVLTREAGWTGTTPAQKEVAERFSPVTLSIWAATGDDRMGDGISTADAMASFEKWFEESRKTAFLDLMEREVVELPLVEIS